MVIMCFALMNVIFCFAQNNEGLNYISKKNAISLNVAGTTPFVGITYERLLSNRFNFEVGLGLYSVGLGIKFFPFPISDNKMVFHTGFVTNLFATPFDTFGSGDFSSTNYIMIGLSYFGKEGFNFAIDIGPSLNYDFTFNEISNPIYGNLKLGYRF